MNWKAAIALTAAMVLIGAAQAQQVAPPKPAERAVTTDKAAASNKKTGDDADLFEPKNSLPCEFFGPCGRCDCPKPSARERR